MAQSDDLILGIDLGTTNSEVAILRGRTPEVISEDGAYILPSCVGVDDAGNVIVGRQARNQALIAPERTVSSIKRRMGTDDTVELAGETYSPQEISAFILKELMERARRVTGQDINRAVITVPAYFTEAQRQATRDAGTIAGLDVVRIINEPTAAALGYQGVASERSIVLVYDLGGGTFDVSIVSIEEGVVEVMATVGDNALGGDDFDAVIAERLNEHLENRLRVGNQRTNTAVQARLTRAAENAKIALSNRPFIQIEEDHLPVVGHGKPLHLSLEISRAEFEQDIQGHLEKTIRLVSNALEDADVGPSEIDRVLLVGGSTRIPRVSELLKQKLGQEPHGGVDPDLCVALGAAVQAGLEAGKDVSSVLVDLTPYSFGTSALKSSYTWSREFVPVIRKNTKLPAKRSTALYTVFEEQEKVNFRIYQGEDPDPEKNIQIGNFVLTGLNEEEGHHSQGIILTFELDVDGLLKVHAVERASGREISGEITNATGRTGVEQLEHSAKRVSSKWENEGFVSITEPDEFDDADEEESVEELVARVNSALESAEGESREELSGLLQRLQTAVEDGREEDIEDFAGQIDDLLFFMGA